MGSGCVAGTSTTSQTDPAIHSSTSK